MMMQDMPTCFPNANPPDPSGAKPQGDPAAKNCIGYYVPHNYDATSFSGLIPLRYALANSLNVPATQTMEFVGATPDTSAAFLAQAQRMGVTSLTKQAMGPTTALGTQNISLLQLTNAYSVFADQGKHVPPRSVLEITDTYGNMLYKAPANPQAAQVLSPQAAYEITSILSDATARIPDFNRYNPLEFNDGPDSNAAANQLNFPDIAAKTGTSQGISRPARHRDDGIFALHGRWGLGRQLRLDGPRLEHHRYRGRGLYLPRHHGVGDHPLQVAEESTIPGSQQHGDRRLQLHNWHGSVQGPDEAASVRLRSAIDREISDESLRGL